MDKAAFLELVEFLRGKRVFIQTHNFPDQDAIGSGYGLKKLLGHYGVETTLCYVGQIDRVNTKKMTELCGIEIYPEDALPVPMAPEDLILCVDSQKGGGNIRDLVGDEIGCIDHHPLVEGNTYRYQDVRKVGSCCTLIAEYYRDLGLTPDGMTATALLYGLKMDTMHFTRGVTPMDIEMFAFLFPYVSQTVLTELSNNSMEFKDLRAYGSAIENIFVYEKVGFAGIPFSCPDAQIAVVADFILSLEEVEVAVVYATRPDGIKFSVRSETVGVDAGKLIAGALAGIGSGGGHAFMAGGFIPGANVAGLGEHSDHEIRERFLARLKSAT